MSSCGHTACTSEVLTHYLFDSEYKTHKYWFLLCHQAIKIIFLLYLKCSLENKLITWRKKNPNWKRHKKWWDLVTVLKLKQHYDTPVLTEKKFLGRRWLWCRYFRATKTSKFMEFSKCFLNSLVYIICT